MGKYTKKAKMTADVALTDVSQSYLGVRTNAKTLALQHRLPSAAATALPPSKPDACYLELRSRRLEKHMQPQNSRNPRRRSCGCRGGEGTKETPPPPADSTQGEALGIEASFGENNSNFDVRERGTRESTPCSSSNGTVTVPGSTMKQACPTAVRNAVATDSPSACELEEFFAREEQSIQLHFVEKYNFDIVRDLPVAGRYEWVAVRP